MLSSHQTAAQTKSFLGQYKAQMSTSMNMLIRSRCVNKPVMAADPMKMLTDRWQNSKKVEQVRLRKVAFDDKVHTTYVKKVQPIVLREIKKKTVRHIVQPIIHEIDDEADHEEEFVRPVTYREIHEDVADDIHEQINQNQYTIANMIENEAHDVVDEEEHFQTEEIKEVVHEEISTDIQPIVKRKINRRIRVNEVQPVQETVHRIEQVGNVEVRQPVTANEWQLSHASIDDDESDAEEQVDKSSSL